MNPTAFCLLFLSLLITGCNPAGAPKTVSNKPISINDVRQTNVPLPPSKPLQEMKWTGFDGKISQLKDFQGKVVILDFWATNCPPCIQEIPHLNQLLAKYGEENIRIIGLHVGDEEDVKLVPEFSERLKISYPLAKPEDDLTRFIFQQRDDIPQTAIFDRKGIMVKKIIGFDSDIKKELDDAVELAVNPKP